MMDLTFLFWVLVSFLSGSVPYSVLLGKYVLRKDITRFGDGNPGATNVVKAGGRVTGGLAVLLDGFKAAIPIGLAYFLTQPPLIWMLAIALAPLFGHRFSPFLKGRGGKAVSSLFGVWAGLTLGEVPMVLGLLMGLWVFVLDNSAWQVVFSLICLLAYLLLHHPAPLLLAVWIASSLFLVYTHLEGLAHPPHLKPELLARFKINH